MEKLINFKRTDFNPTGEKVRVVFDDFKKPLYIQHFCASYECDIPMEHIHKAGDWLRERLNFNEYTKNKLVAGRNLIIYWEDMGRGTFEVITKF